MATHQSKTIQMTESIEEDDGDEDEIPLYLFFSKFRT
jgi:hypothetical protein